MRYKGSLIVGVVIFIALLVMPSTKDKPVKIEGWSGNLSAEQMEWAVVSKGYGDEQISYDLPAGEYEELITQLETVTGEVTSLKRPKDIHKNDYDLVLMYDQKLWLFQCYDSGIISLALEAEVAEAYDCGNSLLYIDSPALWEYIIDTVDSKATK